MQRLRLAAALRATLWVVGVWAMVGLGPTGCRSIARYPEASQRDQGVADVACCDVRPGLDQRAVDITPEPDLAPDLTVDTIDWVNCAPFDLPDTSALCTAGCPDTDIDGDCDGIPDLRDPQPGVCNTLNINGDLTMPQHDADSPLSITAVEERCASVAMTTGSKLVVTDPPTSGPFVVETRFTLGQVLDDTNWRVALHIVPASSSERINCELWVSWFDGYYYQQNPGIHAASSNCGGQWTGDRLVVPDDIGTTYTLQASFVGTKLLCKLFDEGDALVDQVTTSACSTAPVGAPEVRLITRGRDATTHYLRVYDYN